MCENKKNKRIKKKTTKKIRQTVKASISVMAGWIQLKFGIGALTEGVSTTNMVNFHLGTIELQMKRFLDSCKTACLLSLACTLHTIVLYDRVNDVLCLYR